MPLQRRNTIATVPSHVTAPTNPPHSASFTTVATSSSYTSMKEAIAASNSSPIGSIASGSGEISIKNHLVKQAAWAYLRPVSASPDSSADHLLCRLASAVLNFPLFSLLRSAARAVVNVFGCLGF